MMSPPATIVNDSFGSNTGVSLRCGSLAVSPHAATVFTASTPNNV
jgi:hypothetical protein